MAKNTFDIEMMTHAMSLAQRGEGWVNPNPMVGAVIVRGGQIIAEGWHQRFGDLHAERNAFKYADTHNVNCEGATMYVTLEPCCHHGHQPPCTDAIIEHKVARVVVGLRDPNPLVAGKGMTLLHEAGIEAGYLDDEDTDRKLKYQNRVFLKYITSGMPWVNAKWAMTLDGKIATATGDSKWVSSAESLQKVHLMRRRLKAIMCGIGTVLADDPMLNVRLSEDTCKANDINSDDIRQPIRIVADHHLRIPMDCKLVKSAREIPLIVIADNGEYPTEETRLTEAGVTVWHCADMREAMQMAGKAQIDSILLEGGGRLNETFLAEGLIDEVTAFVAPKMVGGAEALSPVEGKGIKKMADAVALMNVTTEMIGADVVINGLVKKCLQE